MAGARPAREGMTLIEIMIVVVIVAFAAAGMGYSVGALARTNLKASATRVAAAARFAYARAVTQGRTVRLAFELPAATFSIQEAEGPVVLSRPDADTPHGVDEEETGGAVDPWAAARERVEHPDGPALGASPFSAISGSSGKPIKRYQKIELGRHVHIVKLTVPHEPEPREQGLGAVHFFPTGYGEHAVLQLSDGTDDGIYSVEIKPLTGRCIIHKGAYEPDEFLDDPDDPGFSEVDE